MPLQQRVPKRGFNNKFRVQPEIVNLGELSGVASGTRVDPEFLKNHGLIRGSGAPVKLLGRITRCPACSGSLPPAWS